MRVSISIPVVSVLALAAAFWQVSKSRMTIALASGLVGIGPFLGV